MEFHKIEEHDYKKLGMVDGKNEWKKERKENWKESRKWISWAGNFCPHTQKLFSD